MIDDDLGGYFRKVTKEETKNFVWNISGKSIWFFIVRSNGDLVGFTSSKSGKSDLLRYLCNTKENCKLVGVWNGTYATHLFLLDIPESIKILRKLVNP